MYFSESELTIPDFFIIFDENWNASQLVIWFVTYDIMFLK